MIQGLDERADYRVQCVALTVLQHQYVQLLARVPVSRAVFPF